jgi:hypothetical protein
MMKIIIFKQIFFQFHKTKCLNHKKCIMSFFAIVYFILKNNERNKISAI